VIAITACFISLGNHNEYVGNSYDLDKNLSQLKHIFLHEYKI